MSSSKKIIFRVADGDFGQNNNIKETQENINGSNEFFKLTYTVEDSNVPMPALYSNKLITKEKNVNIDQIFFNNLRFTTFNGQSYSSISVYYSTESVALLVKFENNPREEWFVRKDEVGIYWAYEKSGYEENIDLEYKLKQIQSSIKDKVTYLLDKNSSYSDYVEISKDGSFINDFEKYIHRPRLKIFNTSLLLYKGAPLESMKSDKLEKITELQQQTYESVTVFFGTKLKLENEFPPLIVKLKGSRGNKIQYYVNKKYDFKFYWDEIDGLSTDIEDKLLIARLKKAQFDLFQSVLILIDIQRNGKYDDKLFTQAVIKEKLNAVKGKYVDVKNTNNYDFLKPFDFNVYEHDISKLVVSFEHVSETILGLRIFLRNGTNNCSDLELYNKNTDSISREYIYYEKKKDTLFVFFYGTDPRPLLFCYNGQMFRPHSPENYDKKWVRVQRADNLTYESGILNEKLLEILLEVTYIMNPVRINMCVKDEESNSYVTQTFYNSKKNEIKINVYHDDVGDFIRYTHESDNRGHNLGEISHNGNKLFPSYEDYSKGLSKEYKNKLPYRVSAYYHIDDHSHKYPLMISLEYESDTLGYITNNTSDYYKLTTKNNPMKWTKIQNNSSKGIKNDGDKEFLDEIQNYEEKTREMITKLTQVDQAETSIQPQTYDESELNNAIKKKLKQIIETLSIDYTKDGKNTNIAHPHKLNDDSNSGAVAGTITTLSLAGAGGGFLFYKYQAVVMSFIRGLFH